MPENSNEVALPPEERKVAYLFLDEGGNFDFSPNGTKYFTLTGVRMFRPFPIDHEMLDLRFDLMESGLICEYFHASEDRQEVRDKVFLLIRKALASFRVDSVIVEKCKTVPSLRNERRFYPEMMGHLLQYVIKGTDLDRVSEFIIIADNYPNKKKRRAVEGAVKAVLANVLPRGLRYRFLHQESKACCGLQIADYFNWAIFRRWERDDWRSFALLMSAVHSQFDIFQLEQIKYY